MEEDISTMTRQFNMQHPFQILIHPSIAASNTSTLPLAGNFDIIRPSNNSSLVSFFFAFDNWGIAMSAPTRVKYWIFTDGLAVGGFMTGTGKARLLAEVDNHISKFSYSRSDVGNITNLTNYYNRTESLNRFSSIAQCDSTTGLTFYNKAIKNGYLWNNFKALTSTSNISLSENDTDQPTIFDVYSNNISNLANYYLQMVFILYLKYKVDITTFLKQVVN